MTTLTDPIQLSQPVKRGETEISEVRLSEPTAGTLQGLKLTDILQMDVTTMTRLLPRITDPALDENEVARLSVRDLTTLSGSAVSFFISTAQRAQIEQAAL